MFALGVALILVAAVAFLLLWILVEASGIARAAKRVLGAAEQVEARTQSLWAIPEVHHLLQEGWAVVERIERKVGALAGTISPERRNGG